MGNLEAFDRLLKGERVKGKNIQNNG